MYSQSGFYFATQDKDIEYIVISVLGEDLIPVKFHGGHWSITIEFSILRAQPFSHQKVIHHLLVMDRSEAQRALRMINGRPMLQGADVEIANITSKVETLSSQILINKEDIASLSYNLTINSTTTDNMNMLLQQSYIPQEKKIVSRISMWMGNSLQNPLRENSCPTSIEFERWAVRKNGGVN